MNTAAKVYVTTIIVLAVGLVVTLPGVDSFAPGSGAKFSFVVFAAIGVLAEAMAIDFRMGSGRQAKSSLAFLPFLASIVVFPQKVAVLVVAFVVAVSQLVLRRNELLRSFFNVGQGVLSAGLGSYAYIYFLASSDRTVISIRGFVFLAAVFFTTNLLLSGIALALIRGHRVGATMRQVIGSRGANLWYDLLASPIALVPAALYERYQSWGLIIIALPLLLIRRSYLQKAQIEEANRDLLKVLVKAIETRDPYTSGHSVRVASLAKAIADDLKLPPRHVEHIETAALLHDIGKIDSVYEAVIRKPYDLNPAERELIKTHATKGADLLQTLTSVNADIIRAVRHHHERFDGTGYPAGLVGNHIPVAARIIMLCDSIDAMLSDRPYRKALTIEKTRHELVRCSGTQFDPEIVQVILARNTLERAAWLAERPSIHDVPEAIVLSHSA
jgi:putative nucleotidyltransferase with HDIG domain